ncbi:4Fe-4S binding protein [Sphingobacterium oryzagri]|uniref:4Fe-4S binding protein n=1 Tax=Sphingobacterium oryzagri TaxID=3025669 RepID=A0ABY7WJG7_9SPHI|nr:4Fe-4S binding protein [Sphingobacterium sp. KACC 22765]WDF69721.1 4Fe-4S binding protein [Sphingobacterium sp. KACC 22765]
MVTIIQHGPPIYILKDAFSNDTLTLNTDRCINCELCTTECPNGAVQMDTDVGGFLKFYVGSCDMVGACAEICPTDALVFSGAECSDTESIMTVMPGNGSVTITGVGTTERLYSWVILRNHMDFWHVKSVEKATLKKLTKPNGSIDWQFEDIEHLGHNIIGQTFGVDVSISVSTSKTVGLYHAGLTLQGTCVLSAICKGFPLTTSYPFNAQKIFDI